MKNKRRWLAIAPLVVAVMMAVVTASAGGASTKSSSSGRFRLDHRLGRCSPPAGGKGLRQGASEGQGEDRHLRRRRQRRDHIAGEDPAVEPHGQGLAGRDLQRAGQRPGVDGIQAVRLRSARPRLVPAKNLNSWPSPSRLQCTVNGREVCVQDNLAQTVLWYDKTLMDKFGYTVPTTWQEWAASVRRSPPITPANIGNTGDSYSAWTNPWADKCPIEPGAGERQRPHQLDGFALHPHGQPARSADPEQDRAGRTSSRRPSPRRTANLPKVLMMPGPTWYAKDVFSGTLKAPPGTWPLQCRSNGTANRPPRPVRSAAGHGSSRGTPRTSRPPATSSPGSRRRPVVKEKGPGTLPTGLPPSAGWRTSARIRTSRRARQSRPSGRGQAHLEGLEHGHLSRPARLVEHRRHATGRRQVAERL